MRDVSLPIKSEAVIINDLLEVRSFEAGPEDYLRNTRLKL
jgi:hypothetical protein